MVIPGLVVVVDHGGAQAPGGVDAGAGDGDRGQVDHEHGEPDWKRSKHLVNKSKQTVRNVMVCICFSESSISDIPFSDSSF